MPRTTEPQDDVESLSDLVDGLTLRSRDVSADAHPARNSDCPPPTHCRPGHVTPPQELPAASSPASSPPPLPPAEVSHPPAKTVPPAPAAAKTVRAKAQDGSRAGNSPVPPPPVPPVAAAAPDPRLRRPAPVSAGLRRQSRRGTSRPGIGVGGSSSRKRSDPRRRFPGPVSVGRRHRSRAMRTTGASGRPLRITLWALCGLALPLLENPPREVRIAAAVVCAIRYLVMLAVFFRVLRRCIRVPADVGKGIPLSLATGEERTLLFRGRNLRNQLPPRKDVMAWEEWAPRRTNRTVVVCVLGALVLAALDVCVRLAADLAQMGGK